MRQTPESFQRRIGELVERALDFVPTVRVEQTVRRWISPSIAASYTDQDSYAEFALRTADVAADHLLSVPSASGGTAFDRMARSFAGTEEEKSVIEALRASRFHVLRVEGGLAGGSLDCSDLVNHGRVILYRAPILAQAPGLAFLCRMARGQDGQLHIAGEISPLDDAALAVATGPACPAHYSREKEARWVETVCLHIVRHGTAPVPGINATKPAFTLPDLPDQLARISDAFKALKGVVPDEALIAETRRLACRDYIIMGTVYVMMSRAKGDTETALAFERLTLIMLETLRNREMMIDRVDGHAQSIEHIRTMIEDAVVEASATAALRDVFRELCRRLPSAATDAEDADMQRLLGRIRALRAKTVDQGCTEEEALAAAEKAAELLDRHGLTLSELGVMQQPCGGLVVSTGRKRLSAADLCAPGIAAFFDCRHWTEQPAGETLRHIFFGMRADVAAAEYLFAMVEHVFADELAAFRRSDIYAALKGDRHAATKSFQEGLADGIKQKLKALREARASHMVSSSGRDLVPVKSAAVEAAMEKLGLNLNAHFRSLSSRTLSAPFAAGQAAAERFQYLPAVAACG